MVMPAADRLLRQRQRHAVGRKRLRLAAKQLPRELIEDDNLGEPSARGRAPAPALAAGNRRMGVAELAGDRCIELRPATEPVVLAVLFEPEFEDVACAL